MSTWLIERELVRLRNTPERPADMRAYVELPLPVAPAPASGDEPDASPRGVQTFEI